jgi:glycosyltransferase involved in cell wall biosynthesis
MINRKKIVVVLPAYNAGKTIEATVREIPECVDEIILVDDRSTDDTVEKARGLGLRAIVHDRNMGYGGNQKTCYRQALATGADIVVMLHPDYQYSPLLITALASMVAYDVYDLALGSRMLMGQALAGGMPLYKYVANRALTVFQNTMLGASLSEYHTGFRAYSSAVLRALPLERNSDDFVFDNQLIAQCLLLQARIGEVSCPARYFAEASSIGFGRSLTYGLGVLKTTWQCWLAKRGLVNPARYQVRRLHSAPSTAILGDGDSSR